MNDNEEFVTRSTEMAMDVFKKDPNMDGQFLIFAEAKLKENSAMWAIGNADQEAKELMLKLISAAMQLRNVDRYSIMSLAWMAEQSKVQAENSVAPSDDPLKKEVLVVSVDGNSNSNNFSTVDVIRDDKNKLVGYGKPMHLAGGSGIFYGLTKNFFSDKQKILADRILSDCLIHGEPMPLEDAHITSFSKFH